MASVPCCSNRNPPLSPDSGTVPGALTGERPELSRRSDPALSSRTHEAEPCSHPHPSRNPSSPCCGADDARLSSPLLTARNPGSGFVRFALFSHPPSRPVPIGSRSPPPLPPRPPLPRSKASHPFARSGASGSFPAVTLWSGQCLKRGSSSRSRLRHPPGFLSSPVSAPPKTRCAPCAEPALGKLDIASSLPQVMVALALGWREHRAGLRSMMGAA